MSSKIKILEDIISSHIAAGEVVQNPASVVKELLENSIDAGANKISIEIQNAGKNLIKIIDNGCGFSKLDLEICAQKHATSKIKNLDDIYKVSSLGMRGEALYSLRVVSDLSIISKIFSEEIGFIWQNGVINAVGCNNGTVITSKNLFYNTPARQKFLKSNKYESDQIKNIIISYAVCYSNINFTFIKDKEILVVTNPIKMFFDYEFDDMINFSEKIEDFVFTGHILNGKISNKSLIFVNKRLIKDFKINAIVRKIYRDISGKESIAFILFIECDFSFVDVNVHPSKTEVRFHSNDIYNNIYNVFFKAFNNNQLNNNNNNINNDIVNHNCLTHTQQNYTKDCKSYINKDYLNKNDLSKDDLKVKESKFSDLDKFFNMETHNNVNNVINTPVIENNYYDNVKPIGQIFYRYILCEKEDNLLIIDQHAAHERIVSENIKDQIAIQKLNIPIIVNRIFSETIYKNLESVIEMTLIGKQTIITGIPSILKEKYIQQFINNIHNINEKTTPISILCDFIHEYGCKNSIKTGHILDIEVMKALIQSLKETPNNLFCNHGRRILIPISKKKIDSMFGRLNFSDLDL